MAIVEAKEVFIRSLSNGRVHTKYAVGENELLASREGCNLDQAEQTVEITEEEARATNPALLCRNDFVDVVFVDDPDHDDGTVEADEEV